ncbi:tRNA (guanine-N(1)-)-methyltransferase [Serratia symbiotica]|nr:tRNA (guanine-N(1)-)-methyltransferase [Serratia symbiotica]
MFIGIISLFPKMFRTITKYGIISRAIKNSLLHIQYWNPRDFTYDKHHTVDDRPYGGGPGMLIMAKPLKEAIYAAKNKLGINVKVIYLSPQGNILNQNNIYKLININKMILVCGQYEGIDERVIQSEINEEWSIGNYILSCGELPAMIFLDTIARLIPGVLKNKNSSKEDSFSNGLLDYPHYTRPKIVDGMKVPSVLMSGNHKKIRQWRLKQSLGNTWIKKPEFFKKIILTNEQLLLLTEFQTEYKIKNKT